MNDIPNPVLRMIQNDEEVARLELAGDRHEWIVGRGESADLVVPHPSVGLHHARLFVAGGEVFIEDIGTSGGTFVGGRRIAGVTRLGDRERVLLGQADVAKPWWIELEDPAARLLTELGLPAAESSDPSPISAPAGANDGAAEPARAVMPPAAVAARPMVRRFDRRRAALGGLVAMVAFVLATWGLLTWLRPTSTAWRSVQVSPPIAEAEGDLILQSPDIYPSDALTVTLAGKATEVLDQRRGRLTLRVPELGRATSGIHDVPLVVRRNGGEIYQRMTRYSVRPRIRAVRPLRATVGELLTLTGSGFSEQVEEVRVRFGDRIVAAASSTPERIEVRVPVVTRSLEVRVPVEVVIGEWEAPAPSLVPVQPRQEAPLAFTFTAEFDPSRGAWRLDHPLGTALWIPGAAPAAGEAPATIERILERWDVVFQLAAEDPELEIAVRSRRDSLALVASAESFEAPLELARWGAGELVRLMSPERSDISAEMLCHWIAGVWNDFLEVFSRGRKLTPDDLVLPPYAVALNGLVEANLAAGGSGRPEDSDLEALDATPRRLLAEALLPVPRHVGSVAGEWLAELENVFLPEQDLRVEVILDLDQRGKRLSGRARLELRNATMDWQLPATRVSGRLIFGSPARVELDAWFGRPVGKVELSGVLGDGSFEGTFESGAVPAQWRARRLEAPAVPLAPSARTASLEASLQRRGG
ncbi:MAG: FHA domain-containing protein [Acidobacteriota bacterium]